MATQNLSSPVSSEFPQDCSLEQSALAHENTQRTIKSLNQALRDLENQTDSELPFLTDGFVDRCIAVTDHALLIRWIELEEYRYGAL